MALLATVVMVTRVLRVLRLDASRYSECYNRSLEFGARLITEQTSSIGASALMSTVLGVHRVKTTSSQEIFF